MQRSSNLHFFFRNNFFAYLHKFDVLQLALDRAGRFFIFGLSGFLSYKFFLQKKRVLRVPAVAQWVKDLAQLWGRLQLQLRFDPWP